MFFARVFVVFFSFSCIHGLPKPPYITACYKNDPNLNQCALESAKIAIPEIVKGDPVYNIPKMNPLFISSIEVPPVSNIKLKTANLTVRGLETTIPVKFNYNMTSQDMKLELFLPFLDIQGQYSLSGRLLVFPVEGNGKAHIRYVNGTYTYYNHFEVVEKKGVKHLDQVRHHLDLECERAYFNFTNLFNGNKLLADNILTFMDENWKEVNKEFGPIIAAAIDKVAYYISNSFFAKVPFDELFLP